MYLKIEEGVRIDKTVVVKTFKEDLCLALDIIFTITENHVNRKYEYDS